jgi:hypothetical protein
LKFSTLRLQVYFSICSIIFESGTTENTGRVVYRVPVVLVEGILVEYPPTAREARRFRMRRPMVLIISGVQTGEQRKRENSK